MRLWFASLLVLLSINLLGLAVVYRKLDQLPTLFPKDELSDVIKTQNQLSTQLATLSDLVSKTNRLDTPNAVLGVSDLLPDKNTSQNVTTNYLVSNPSSTTPVQVYKEQADFSVVIGQLIPGYKYPYFAKLGDWYMIGLGDGITGWVKSAEVTTETK